jgi:hypothetical protein
MPKKVEPEPKEKTPPLNNPRYTPPKDKTREDAKKNRLAQALRENLKKRKEQIRARGKPKD